MAAPHVCILQTSFAKREDTVAFLKEKVPGVRVEFITDSTLLTDVRANGGPSQAVIDRMTLYAKAAEISGADLIVNSCSTVGEVADIYAKEVNVPVMKIDLPMAQEAVRLGTKIALIATLETTLGPSQRLIEKVGAEQGKKPLNEAIPGENLNLLMGSRPLGEEGDSDRVKLRVLDMLHEKYGICEDDFTSAELEVVPAFNATDLGLDRSLIGAYGHDDRVCGYAALKGLFDIDVPEKTAVCMLADKEEVGSMGVTGMQSAFFDTFMEDLCQSQGVSLRVCYESSFCLSSDVTAAYDPNFAEVYEKRNESRVNYGLGICKYTGARGKSGSSDADAETVAYVRRVLDNAGVVWQIGEMGKIDAGGGGTVAQYMANRNITTIDAGVPVLSMHSPFETVGKLDCYMNYLGCMAVYNA